MSDSMDMQRIMVMSMVGKENFKEYRKKPIVIKAYRNMGLPISITTLEGTMTCNTGDWIIIGINGEVYPCKDDIFQKTYQEYYSYNKASKSSEGMLVIDPEIGEKILRYFEYKADESEAMACYWGLYKIIDAIKEAKEAL